MADTHLYGPIQCLVALAPLPRTRYCADVVCGKSEARTTGVEAEQLFGDATLAGFSLAKIC